MLGRVFDWAHLALVATVLGLSAMGQWLLLGFHALFPFPRVLDGLYRRSRSLQRQENLTVVYIMDDFWLVFVFCARFFCSSWFIIWASPFLMLLLFSSMIDRLINPAFGLTATNIKRAMMFAETRSGVRAHVLDCRNSRLRTISVRRHAFHRASHMIHSVSKNCRGFNWIFRTMFQLGL